MLALEDARLFAVLVESWSRPDCETYKHELKSNAELSMERIDKALAGTDPEDIDFKGEDNE
jgi:hypothetical protein